MRVRPSCAEDKMSRGKAHLPRKRGCSFEAILFSCCLRKLLAGIHVTSCENIRFNPCLNFRFAQNSSHQDNYFLPHLAVSVTYASPPDVIVSAKPHKLLFLMTLVPASGLLQVSVLCQSHLMTIYLKRIKNKNHTCLPRLDLLMRILTQTAWSRAPFLIGWIT